MKNDNLKFPKNFFWGAAAASQQVEGNNINNWSKWEKENAEHLACEAKNNWQEWQKKKFPEMFEAQNYISGLSCNHYNRFSEDFDIAKNLGLNAFRISFEWSRIEPEQGKFSDKEIEHYKEVITALRERCLEPFITLWHWTLPLWVSKTGGWENKETIKHFLKYAEKIVGEFKDIKFFIPINEPTIYTGMSYVTGKFPPNVKSLKRSNMVLKNLIAAYKETYNLIHEKLGKGVMVGNANNLHSHIPFRKWHPLDILAAKILNYIRDVRSLKWTLRYEDFIGLNYYFRDTVKFVLWGGKYGIFDIKNPDRWVSDMGWDIYPKGIYNVLIFLKKYKKPIYITENGIADRDDKSREKFIEEHLFWIQKAMEEGADVRGYFYWSLTDNFEWDKGFWPRFGLVEIDYKTLKRKIRPSAYAYRDIISKSGEL